MLGDTEVATASVGKAVNNVWNTPIPGVTTGSDTPGTFFDVVAALAPYDPQMAGLLLSVTSLSGGGDTEPWSIDNIIVTGIIETVNSDPALSFTNGWGPNGDRGFFEQVGHILEDPLIELGALLDRILQFAWNNRECFDPIHINTNCGG